MKCLHFADKLSPLDVEASARWRWRACGGVQGYAGHAWQPLSPCIFDIWPKPRDWMKEQAGKKSKIKSGVCVYSLFCWIFNEYKWSENQDKEINERQTCTEWTQDVKTEVPEWFTGWKTMWCIIPSILHNDLLLKCRASVRRTLDKSKHIEADSEMTRNPLWDN